MLNEKTLKVIDHFFEEFISSVRSNLKTDDGTAKAYMYLDSLQDVLENEGVERNDYEEVLEEVNKRIQSQLSNYHDLMLKPVYGLIIDEDNGTIIGCKFVQRGEIISSPPIENF
ncbi:MAG: hypothetical protein ABRQ25_09860 [Clostridiaceae bacterium]